MKIRILLVLSCLLAFASSAAQQTQLRVFIRGGAKTHGPNQHDHPRFLADWKKLLAERGCQTDGSMEFPTAAQLEKTDVVVIYAADGMKITGEHRTNFEKYLQRGGGLVVVHDGVVSGEEHEWAKKVQGGAWIWKDKKTKWYEGEVGIYFVDMNHPITKGISNFDWKDEIYHELDMAPDAHILATSFHSVFVVAPQLWTYEKTWEGGSKPFRTFVSLPGHEYDVFNSLHYRAILLRGIAWAGKRENTDSLCNKEELASLKYPVGGPTAPDKATAKFNVHPEFEINLVASEPLIEKAISMDWDAKGRLWVAETPEYPGGRTINKNDAMVALWASKNPEATNPGAKEDRPARDRISWLEDTNKDGVMDKKHVFADGLELVTSLVLHKDGVIVAQAPDILWLRDMDGDGKCNMQSERIVLYTGFGTMDTHAVINNFRWGMDGWVYGAVGYSAGAPKSGDGSKDFGRITAGLIRFKPDGSAVEQFASGSCNTWGFDFAPDNEPFYTTATCGEHFLHVVMPEKALARGNVGGLKSSMVLPDHQKIFPAVKHTRPAYIQIDWVGAFTASAGSCIYNGGAWPERYNGTHFSSETTMSLVHHDTVKPKGVSYMAGKEEGREEAEFLAGSDLWFRPIHTRVGPDGALYIVDFYNQAAIHNDTRGPKHGARNAAVRPDRDHHFGRIWRVQHKQAKKLPAAKLDTKKAGDLVDALEHPNGWVRMTAQRLLNESKENKSTVRDIEKVAKSGKTPYAQIHALWALHQLGALDQPLLTAALGSREPIVRKNALQIAADTTGNKTDATRAAVMASLKSDDARTRLQALITLGAMPADAQVAKALAESYPSLQDRYLESAAVGIAAKDPLMFITAALESSNADQLSGWVGQLSRQLALKNDGALAANLVVAISKQAASADTMKQVALESLAANSRAENAPAWSPEIQKAFQSLLASKNPAVPGAALPLIARWDKNDSMGAELKPIVTQLASRLQDTSLSEEQRGQVAANLLGVRQANDQVIPLVAKEITSSSSAGYQRRLIEALGNTPSPAAGNALISVYPQVPDALREIAFNQILRRNESATALLQAVQDKKIQLAVIGPASVHRLRTHSDKSISERANKIIDELRGPEQKEKDALIAQLAPAVQTVGNLENGRKLFTQNCATCHKFKNEGSDLAPDLTGMGAHGPLDLLVHIVDPNRVVEPNFISVSLETKDDESYDGIVARENQNTIILRNAVGEKEIRKSDVKSRRSTGLSLMPNGLETLGADGLRDVISYICADEGRFRIIDITPAFTVTTTKGMFNSQDARDENLRFRKFGMIKAGEVPFELVSPTRSANGNNVVVLRGGSGFAKSLPQRVEVPNLNLKATRLHFLGGVGGWAYPCCGDNQNNGQESARVIVKHADGKSEEFVLKNGVEFADYNSNADVPGSKLAVDIATPGRQVRSFSRNVSSASPITSIILESTDKAVAPLFAAITAETADAGGHGAGAHATEQIVNPPKTAAVTQQKFEWGSGIKTLIVGGGSSHDFKRWFDEEDKKILSEGGKASVFYSDKTSGLAEAMKAADVLYLSNNQPFKDAAERNAVMAHVNAGKGLMLVHPALWYNWNDWAEYNKELCGGGSRGHDKFGEFEVEITEPNHPLVKGLPKKFMITDELYYFEPAPGGTPIKVLATAFSKAKNKSYPQIFVVEHPKTKIVGITLGHDGKAHQLPEFRKLLQNSLEWVSEKK